jgi:serine protein kinase
MLEANSNPTPESFQRDQFQAANEDIRQNTELGGRNRESLQAAGNSLLDSLVVSEFREQFLSQHSEVDFVGYLAMVKENPEMLIRSAHAYLHDALMHLGTKTIEEDGVSYKVPVTLTDDPFGDGGDKIVGNARLLTELSGLIRQGAERLGAEKRIVFMLGPVGTVKSSIARCFKKALEAYSRTEEGATYTCSLNVPRKIVEAIDPLSVKLSKEDMKDVVKVPAPMHEDPLGLIPQELRPQFERILNKDNPKSPVRLRSGISPQLELYMEALLENYSGDFKQLLANGHITVQRYLVDESKRVGIGTFEPKNEKNIDAGELTGDEDFRQLARYGSSSDPRVMRPDGELCVGHRHMVELVEGLKLPLEVQNMFLTVSQEQTVKPKKFPQIPVDTVLLAHTNGYEYNKLLGDDSREALRDRVLKLEVLYLTNYKQESGIYEKVLNPLRERMHIAPLTEEMYALWAVLTRLQKPTNESLTLIGKAKLYAGEEAQGFNQRNIKTIKADAPGEGWTGASPRVGQNVIGLTVSKVLQEGKHLSFPHLARELEDQIVRASLSPKVKEQWLSMLEMVKEEYKVRVEKHVQQAIAGDERDLDQLCGKYLDYANAYVQREGIVDPLTRDSITREEIDGFLQSIERHVGVTESKRDQFRTEVMNHVAGLAMRGQRFDYKSNVRLREALEKTLLESVKGHINLTPVIAKSADPDAIKRMNILVDRLCKRFGYSPESATDVLKIVGAKFARESTQAQTPKK